MSCPLCRSELAQVSGRQDYFCPRCLAAICIEDAIAHVYQPENGHSFTVPTSHLHAD